MNRKTKIIIWISVLAVSSLLLFFDTWKGLYDYKVRHWEEEEFVGKELIEFRKAFEDKGGELEIYSDSTYYALTGKNLLPSQRLMRFSKDDGFTLFRLTKAYVFGIVVVEQVQGKEVVVGIVKYLEIDAP